MVVVDAFPRYLSDDRLVPGVRPVMVLVKIRDALVFASVLPLAIRAGKNDASSFAALPVLVRRRVGGRSLHCHVILGLVVGLGRAVSSAVSARDRKSGNYLIDVA